MSKILATTFTEAKDKLQNKPIRLYIVEDGPLVAEILRYAEYGEDVTFPTSGGPKYFRAPIKCENVTENSTGEIDQLMVNFGNVDRSFIHYLELHDGLRSCKVTIRTVFADLLGEADAFSDDIFYVVASSTTQQNASFLLKSKMDLLHVELPLRRFYRDTCQWKFAGIECGYIPGLTTCSHTIQDCVVRENRTRFGGFPGTGSAIWKVYL